MSRTVIFDLGANNGDDIPYYLLKADFVVAVEANPVLCEAIAQRFASEIDSGRLVIENCVLTSSGDVDGNSVEFYIHKASHGLSQFPKPPDEQIHLFDKMLLPSMAVGDLVEKYGVPFYAKIDLEHYDANILESLFAAGVYPEFISSESHSSLIFCLLTLNGYNGFKIVHGKKVAFRYRNRKLWDSFLRQDVVYSFPRHSSGPFADDIDGPWFDSDSFFRILALEGFGWKDIHATRLRPTDKAVRLRTRNIVFWKIREVVLDWYLWFLRFFN